jgi:hypothetical protein
MMSRKFIISSLVTDTYNPSNKSANILIKKSSSIAIFKGHFGKIQEHFYSTLFKVDLFLLLFRFCPHRHFFL